MERTSSNPIYMAWKNMRQRCFNHAHPGSAAYNGRGIGICERWEDFELFASDMGPKPFSAAQLDRIDNNGDYTPTNCRWTTAKVNARNSRQTKLTVAQVSDIKAALKQRAEQSVRSISRDLGNFYNVAPGTIREIASGRSWTEVE